MNCSASLQALTKALSQRDKEYFVLCAMFLLFVIASLFFKVSLFVAEEQSAKFEYTSADLRDPFENLLKKSRSLQPQKPVEQVLPAREVVLPPFSLQGVIWDTSIPQAIIDGKIVKIKDKIKEAEVLDINKEGVTLLFQNKRFIIKPKGGE